MPGMKDFLEWSSLRVWVRDWLRYCRWYYGTALLPDVGIQEFFDAPIVNNKWKVLSEDPNLFRYGLLWKLFYMVALKGCFFMVPILEEHRSPLCGFLLGGVSGTEFLVQACGCDQPQAGRSIIKPGVERLYGEDNRPKTIRFGASIHDGK